MDILPALRTGKLIVVHAPDAACAESMALIAQLGLRGQVTVLDGGNRYKPYQVAMQLRRKTVDVSRAASRVFSRRAFTCYEMQTLLGSTVPQQGPYVILDLLHTFYDDHVQTPEACRLLDLCLEHIQRLVFTGPVVVTLAAPLLEERAFLLERVCAQADEVLVRELPDIGYVQPTLF